MASFQSVSGDIKPGLPLKNFKVETLHCHNTMMSQWLEPNPLHHFQHQMFHNLILLEPINLSYDPLTLPIDHFAYNLRRCHYQPPCTPFAFDIKTRFQSGRSRFFRDLTCNKTRTCNYLYLKFAFDYL